MVRKRRKLEWVVMECSFFSSCTSHCGARCTFFRRTHLLSVSGEMKEDEGNEEECGVRKGMEYAHRPDLEAEDIAFSARLKPSADPRKERRGEGKGWRGEERGRGGEERRGEEVERRGEGKGWRGEERQRGG